jgi:hypothetical protein
MLRAQYPVLLTFGASWVVIPVLATWTHCAYILLVELSKSWYLKQGAKYLGIKLDLVI